MRPRLTVGALDQQRRRGRDLLLEPVNQVSLTTEQTHILELLRRETKVIVERRHHRAPRTAAGRTEITRRIRAFSRHQQALSAEHRHGHCPWS
jgi:hypothetical protein